MIHRWPNICQTQSPLGRNHRLVFCYTISESMSQIRKTSDSESYRSSMTTRLLATKDSKRLSNLSNESFTGLAFVLSYLSSAEHATIVHVTSRRDTNRMGY